MVIVITGGSGFIGKRITQQFLAAGNTVVVVDIVPPSFTHEKLFFISCDITKQTLPYNILEHTDAVINLVGAPISGKWTEQKKKQIRESRITSTKHIVETIANTKVRPSVFVCASSLAFYGDTKDEIVDEQGENAVDFFAGITAEWEMVARGATEYGVRVVCIRNALVLGATGGILSALTKTKQFGFLYRPIKENPWFSWIHIDDIAAIYQFAVETATVQGVLNASAPEPIQLQSFLEILSKTTGKRLVSLPAWVARKLYGDAVEELRKNVRVTPKRVIDKGFTFSFTTISEALTQLFSKK